MSQRILFVDDEQSLLNGIERRFGAAFDVVTANSGEVALGKFDSDGPFAVVVTDMRMPRMNGIEFIKAARVKDSDAVYIMLTGNQDQATAIQALNQGHVFRFLTKPCDSSELVKAVEAGLRQHQLVTGEKELLQQTFYGAVGVLTDVLELLLPNIFSRTQRIQDLVRTLEEALGLEDHWEYKLAARLGMLGFALLPEEERTNYEAGVRSGTATDEQFRHAAAMGQRLIERIPRLGTVAQIIGMQPDVDGSAVIQVPRTENAKAVMGATMLRLATQCDELTRQGLYGSAAVEELRRSLPRLSAEMAEALRELPIDEDVDEGVEVNVMDLEAGMVLLDDVLTSDGVLLIRKGRRLTWTIVERLRSSRTAAEALRPIRIRQSSIKNPEALLCK